MTDEGDGTSFAERLADAMEHGGMHQAELARRLADRYGREPESWRREIVRWLRGDVDQPQRQTIIRLAETLQIEPEHLSPTQATPGLSGRLAAIERRLGALAIVAEQNAQATNRLAGLEARLRELESRLQERGI